MDRDRILRELQKILGEASVLWKPVDLAVYRI